MGANSLSLFVLFVFSVQFYISESQMKPRYWAVPLAAATFIGFLAGACSRGLGSHGQPTSQTVGAALAQDVHNNTDLARLSATYAAIAKAVTPAVVNVNTQQVIPGRVMRDPFGDFFGGGLGNSFREPDRTAQSLGSGVIVDGRGIIITNNHVIENATTITVTLTDHRRFPAQLLGTDPDSDIAVLKINATNLPVLGYADSDKLQVGDIVLAVGSPFNLSSTDTQGIISAKGRHDLGISQYEDFLQTDAAINPGNSGGALVDINGNLVGINSAILSKSGGYQGIGLAIPSNIVKKIGNQLAQSHHIVRGWLGIVVEPLTDDIAGQLGLPATSGVLVTGVYTKGPSADLEWSRNGGDVILKANGVPIDTPGQLRNMVAELAPGATLSLDVWQNGGEKTFNVTIGKRPQNAQGV